MVPMGLPEGRQVDMVPLQEEEVRFEGVGDLDFLPAADIVEGDTIEEISPNPLDAPSTGHLDAEEPREGTTAGTVTVDGTGAAVPTEGTGSTGDRGQRAAGTPCLRGWMTASDKLRWSGSQQEC